MLWNITQPWKRYYYYYTQHHAALIQNAEQKKLGTRVNMVWFHLYKEENQVQVTSSGYPWEEVKVKGISNRADHVLFNLGADYLSVFTSR